MLSRRQVTVQRENLTAMCRISVKCLLDYASLYTHVNDDSEEFINFCAVFEQLVSHGLQPIQKKTWLPGQGSPRHFWDVLLDNYHRTRGFLYQSCIPNIEAIETIKSPEAKLRAFIRLALMEKRLSDYLCWVRENKFLMRESYLDDAFMASGEATFLFAELLGLNAIDFNFCLRANENELLGPLEINYSPFLTYKQSSASQCSDEIEMLRLSGKDVEELKETSSILTESNVNEVLHVQTLEKDMRLIKEQKDYLEELLRLRERQLTEANIRMENAHIEWQRVEKSREQERLTMEDCILELQKEMAKLQKSNDSLKAQVSALKQYKQRTEMKEVPRLEVATSGGREVDKSGIHVQMDSVWGRSNNPGSFSVQPSAMASGEDPSVVDRLSNTKEAQSQDEQGTAALLGTQSNPYSEVALQSQSKQPPFSPQKERYDMQADSTLNPADDQVTQEHPLQLEVKEQVPQIATLAHPLELDVKEKVPQAATRAHPLELDVKEQVFQAATLAHPLELDVNEQVLQDANLAPSSDLDVKDQIPKYEMQNSATNLDTSESSIVAEQADARTHILSLNQERSAELPRNHSSSNSSALPKQEHSTPILSNENCSSAEFQTELNEGLTVDNLALDSLTLAGREQGFPVVPGDNSSRGESEASAEPVVAAASQASNNSSQVTWEVVSSSDQ